MMHLLFVWLVMNVGCWTAANPNPFIPFWKSYNILGQGKPIPSGTFPGTGYPRPTQDAGGNLKWSYGDTSNWVKVSPLCGGSMQSPINIIPNKTVEVKYPSFFFKNYDKILPLVITNDGTTVKLELYGPLPEAQMPSITGGGLVGRYNFAQAHVHWGNDSRRGSEHTVGSLRYAAEIHIVHYNSKYRNTEEAVKHPDGLAVLGVMVLQVERRSLDLGPLEFVDQLFRGDYRLPVTYAVPFILSIPLETLLPKDVQHFYRYFGSLTTPPCNEVVTWTVFTQPIAFSSQQMNRLRSLKNNQGEPISGNYRPVQPLNNRVVTYSDSTEYY